jgi:hypothetical protein
VEQGQFVTEEEVAKSVQLAASLLELDDEEVGQIVSAMEVACIKLPRLSVCQSVSPLVCLYVFWSILLYKETPLRSLMTVKK